jgi:hypothetical protein
MARVKATLPFFPEHENTFLYIQNNNNNSYTSLPIIKVLVPKICRHAIKSFLSNVFFYYNIFLLVFFYIYS